MTQAVLKSIRDDLRALLAKLEGEIVDEPYPFLDKLIEALKKDEGLRLEAYPDPLSGGDPWTIGYGATGPHIRKGAVWTSAKAEQALRVMAQEHGMELEVKEPWVSKLDDVRRAVLWNMAYNLGVEGLRGFVNTLRYVRDGDYMAAANGMLASKWARQVKGRAHRLAREMQTGAWG